jgi:hypothetical protein
VRPRMNSNEQQDESMDSRGEYKQSAICADQALDVRVLLYCFKPPFPSDGGCAAASAGRSGSVSPTAGQVPWFTHWVPLRGPRFSVARPSGLSPQLTAFAVPVVALAATGAAAVFRCYRFL